MDYGTIYFADASALIKLFFQEAGSNSVRAFLAKQGLFYTTSLCVGEALGYMKRQRFGKRPTLTQDQYTTGAHLLLANVRSRCIIILEGDLTDPHTFFEAADLSDKFGIDLSDALQIVSLLHSSIFGATLITADQRLVQVARQIGISAWDCEREPEPEIAACPG